MTSEIPEIDWIKYCNYGVVANVYKFFKESAKHHPDKPWSKAVAEYDSLQHLLKKFFRNTLTSAAYACIIAPTITLDSDENLVRRPRAKSGVCFDATVSKKIKDARTIMKYDPAASVRDKRHATKEALLYATYAAHKKATYDDSKELQSLFNGTFASLEALLEKN